MKKLLIIILSCTLVNILNAYMDRTVPSNIQKKYVSVDSGQLKVDYKSMCYETCEKYQGWDGKSGGCGGSVLTCSCRCNQ